MAVNPRPPRKARKTEAETMAPVGAESGAEGDKKTSLRIKELVERVAAKSEIKKKDLREAVEKTLSEVGAALAAGEGLNLPGLGHIKITRKGEKGAVTLRMRPADAEAPKKKGRKAAEAGAEALADAEEAE